MTDNTLIFLIPAMRHIADYVKNIVSGIFFCRLIFARQQIVVNFAAYVQAL